MNQFYLPENWLEESSDSIQWKSTKKSFIHFVNFFRRGERNLLFTKVLHAIKKKFIPEYSEQVATFVQLIGSGTFMLIFFPVIPQGRKDKTADIRYLPSKYTYKCIKIEGTQNQLIRYLFLPLPTLTIRSIIIINSITPKVLIHVPIILKR